MMTMMMMMTHACSLSCLCSLTIKKFWEKMEKGRVEYNVSSPSSFIANAHNELHTFRFFLLFAMLSFHWVDQIFYFYCIWSDVSRR